MKKTTRPPSRVVLFRLKKIKKRTFIFEKNNKPIDGIHLSKNGWVCGEVGNGYVS
jgi:hypothetical protein